MNKINYNLEMQKLIGNIPNGEKPKLLLHSCCAPCSSACIERLKNAFDITVYYYNPNMDSEQEFCVRASEQERLCKILGVGYIMEKYDVDEFFSFVKGLESEPEGGARCEKCFYLRLNKTAEVAKQKGYDYFATTLTVSPLKNAEKINRIGFLVQENTGVRFLPSDFKKNGGYLRTIELSKEYSLYRQNYCGCIFSKRDK